MRKDRLWLLQQANTLSLKQQRCMDAVVDTKAAIALTMRKGSRSIPPPLALEPQQRKQVWILDPSPTLPYSFHAKLPSN